MSEPDDTGGEPVRPDAPNQQLVREDGSHPSQEGTGGGGGGKPKSRSKARGKRQDEPKPAAEREPEQEPAADEKTAEK